MTRYVLTRDAAWAAIQRGYVTPAIRRASLDLITAEGVAARDVPRLCLHTCLAHYLLCHAVGAPMAVLRAHSDWLWEQIHGEGAIWPRPDASLAPQPAVWARRWDAHGDQPPTVDVHALAIRDLLDRLDRADPGQSAPHG